MASGTIKNHWIWSSTNTSTTNAAGQIKVSGEAGITRVPVAGKCDSHNAQVDAYVYNDQWWVRVTQLGTALANTEVTITMYWIWL